MGIASLKELYLDELGNLYDAETQMIRALARFAETARAPELRKSLARHGEVSRLHLERLQLIFTHWGERVAPRRCLAVAGIVQEADDRVNEATTPDVRDAAVIGAAQRIEHYEIAAYGCARTYARRLNRDDEARLLQETLDEEERVDRHLTEIAEAHVNDDARSEEDENEPSRPARLRYVAADQLDHHRLSDSAHLNVRNDVGDALGVFDGLVVDPDAHPRYIVVHTRGVLGGRRYLVPVGHVRFDERTRALQVDLGKDVADRYPAFDRESFAAMSDVEWHGYEQRMLEFFPKVSSTGAPAGAAGISDAAPDWLLSGVWMTTTPERAEELPEEARSYVNEFTPKSR